MTITPWGHSDALRARSLKPGPGRRRETVARNQRERLFGAMVAVVARRGYEGTRVADLVELSGVSRNTFYTHFDNKLDCFLATIDAFIASATEAATTAYRREGTWEQRLRAGLDALIELVVAQPAAARLCLVDVYAAGPQAVERVERPLQELVEAVSRALRESPERTDMPADVVRAVVGGLRKIVHTRVRLGRERELTALAPDLLAWALGYRTPPEPLRSPRRPRPDFAVQDAEPEGARERIVTALTREVAEKGYPETTLAGIARRASVSLSTFYEHFAGKEEAFLAALDDALRRLLEATLPAYDAGGDWPHAVSYGLNAFFSHLSANPDAAVLGGQAGWAGGAAALDRLDEGIENFYPLLDGEGRRQPGSSPVVVEAVGAGISALLYDHLQREGTKRLYMLAPAATFIALAPFIGTIEACAVANARAPSRAAPRGTSRSGSAASP